MKICPQCGARHKDDIKFCNICGTSLTPSKKYFCPECNYELNNPEVKFCRSCGIKFDEEHKPIERIRDNMLKICPHCGTILQNENAKFCKVCSGGLNEDTPPLPLGDNDKYYRVCLHCGKAYDYDSGITVCKSCNQPLDMKPRISTELTAEEKQQVEKILQQKREEEKKRIKYLEEQKQKKAARRKIAVKIFFATCLAIFIFVCSAYGAWIWIDNNNMEDAETALLSNDYGQAIELYGKISEKSRYYEQSQNRIKEINNAIAKYKSAEEKYKKPSYLDAMKLCKEAKEYNTNMPMIDDLYKTAQDGVGKYVQKLVNEKNYKNALTTINKIDKGDRNETVNAAEKTIYAKIQSYYDEGNKFLKEGSLDSAFANLNNAIEIDAGYKDKSDLKANLAKAYTARAEEQFDEGSLETALELANKSKQVDPSYKGATEVCGKIANSYAAIARTKFNEENMTEALNFANKALGANSENADAKNVKSDAEKYNNYTELLKKAGGQYNRWEISDAHDTIGQVPTDSIGNMVRANFTTLIYNVNNDYQYRFNPVTVVSKDSDMHWKTTYFGFRSSYSYGDISYTIKNNLNRPVKVTLEFVIDYKVGLPAYQYETITLDKNETYSDMIAFDTVYNGGATTYSYGVHVDDYDVQ
ncbi:MAG: zinc ribbon domain-containing protein [Firmicutes bacterium]|nr:zinc ribbon domain-containing protein [Bacillota bacterium]